MSLAACTGGYYGNGRIKLFNVERHRDVDLGGVAEEKGPIRFRLSILNDTPDTLLPGNIVTPCGCTRVEYSKIPIPPGEREIWEVTYDPAYRPGDFREEITMYYAEPHTFRSLHIKGNVGGCWHPVTEDQPYDMGSGLYMNLKLVHMGHIAPGESRTALLRYANSLKKAFDLRFDVPEEYTGLTGIRTPGKVDADVRDTLLLNVTMPPSMASEDTLIIPITPMVNGHPSGEILTIRAIAD